LARRGDYLWQDFRVRTTEIFSESHFLLFMDSRLYFRMINSAKKSDFRLLTVAATYN